MSAITTLKRRKDFLAAAQSGFKYVKPTVIVQARRRNPDEPSASTIRTGFTATKKLGGAVVRNRAKRRLRAAASQTVPKLGLPGCDYVFIGRADLCKGSFDNLIRDMKHALKRLSEIMRGSGARDQGSEKKEITPPDSRPPTPEP
jgi:ribonuclease P protein component